MKKSIYRFLIINISIIALILLSLSFYMLHVLDNSSVKKSANKQFDNMETEIEFYQAEFDDILEQISKDNVAKAKAISIIINQSPKIYLDFESLEELRVALDVQDILITDQDGIVISGTEPYVGQDFNQNEIKKQFLPAIQYKAFTKVINNVQDSELIQYVGVARLDSPGVIYIKAAATYLESSIKLSGISTVVKNQTFLKSGELSIINKDAWEYVSNTDDALIGKTVQMNKEKFKNLDLSGKGDFKMTIQGVEKYTFYREYNDYILLAQVKTSEVFARRNYTTVGIFIALFVISVSVLLATRKKLIDNNIE